jgi:hypothetical protein
MMMTRNSLIELNKIAQGRDYLPTPDFAKAFSKSPATARKNFCLAGHCYGIKPVKIGGRLLWPVSEIAKLLNGESLEVA